MMTDFQKVICPNCQAANRIPTARLLDAPKCGKCKQPLFNAHPVELNSGNFFQHLRGNSIPMVVDFWAPWCGPCRLMAPVFEQAAHKLEPHVRLAKVNTETEPTIASQFAIRSIPTLALFKEGREVSRQAGVMDVSSLINWIRVHS